jgi:molecular chaperone GrpE
VGEKPELTPELEEKLSELEILRQAVDEFKKKAAELYDQLLRSKAEFDNYRKRMDKEKSEARAWGKQEVLVQLIALVDVFEQAMAQAHRAKELKQVVQGVDMLHKSFAAFLKTEGLEPIEIIGKPFDPHLAEALEQQEVDEDQVGLVLGELQKGYLFQGRVLRPSRVRVGVARKDGKQASEQASKPGLT